MCFFARRNRVKKNALSPPLQTPRPNGPVITPPPTTHTTTTNKQHNQHTNSNNDLHPSLHKIHEDDGKPFELELTWICNESGRQHARVPAELAAEAERAAKAALADSDMED